MKMRVFSVSKKEAILPLQWSVRPFNFETVTIAVIYQKEIPTCFSASQTVSITCEK